MKIELLHTVDTVNMKPSHYEIQTGSTANGHYYFWKLSNAWLAFPHLKPQIQGERVIVKMGYAKAERVIGQNKSGRRYGIGAVHRTRETIQAWEKSFNLKKGVLKGKIYGIATHSVNEALAPEQYLHKTYQASDIHFLPEILSMAEKAGNPAPSGKTEFYLHDIFALWDLWLDSQGRDRMVDGWADIRDKKFRGQSGWRLPVDGYRL